MPRFAQIFIYSTPVDISFPILSFIHIFSRIGNGDFIAKASVSRGLESNGEEAFSAKLHLHIGADCERRWAGYTGGILP